MSLFSGIGKALKSVGKSVGGIVKAVAPAAATFLPGPVGTLAGMVSGTATVSPSRAPGPGLSASKAVQMGAPVSSAVPGAGFSLPGMGGSGSWGQVLNAAVTGSLGGPKMKMGKLSGQMIPHGMVERMDPKTGQIYLSRVRRRRGISGRDLATAKRVVGQMKRFEKALGKRR